jgi:phosphoribosylformylglycinamidine (FGAM) synthase-like amidotransferase family enzyme
MARLLGAEGLPIAILSNSPRLGPPNLSRFEHRQHNARQIVCRSHECDLSSVSVSTLHTFVEVPYARRSADRLPSGLGEQPANRGRAIVGDVTQVIDGVCNGCQLLALLGWVPWPGIADIEQPQFIQNASGRFESRFAAVTIEKSPAVMLEGMEGSTLGIWVAHGEGRAYFPEPSILERVERESLAPVRFVDDQGQVTESYPFNPNGSPHGIASLCTPDGRHLVLMPHPERSFLKWQWSFMPEDWKRDLEACPWLRMFQNARAWCERAA